MDGRTLAFITDINAFSVIMGYLLVYLTCIMFEVNNVQSTGIQEGLTPFTLHNLQERDQSRISANSQENSQNNKTLLDHRIQSQRQQNAPSLTDFQPDQSVSFKNKQESNATVNPKQRLQTQSNYGSNNKSGSNETLAKTSWPQHSDRGSNFKDNSNRAKTIPQNDGNYDKPRKADLIATSSTNVPLKCRVSYHEQTNKSLNTSNEKDDGYYIPMCLPNTGSGSNSPKFIDQKASSLSGYVVNSTSSDETLFRRNMERKRNSKLNDPMHIKAALDSSREKSTAHQLKYINIGGLFELSGARPGKSEFKAAEMAIARVNAQNFIPGYHLKMFGGDTKCDPGYGANLFYDLMYNKPKLLMLIATSCSEVAKMLGEIVPYWNLVMVSHASTSPALSDREKYPGFFRLAAADSSHNPARKSFIQHMGWNTVATMIQDVESYALANNEMTKDFEAVNISVKATLSFRDYTEDLHAKMIDLKDSDARIIIGSFHEESARHVFCEAYHMGLYGSRYVWMLLGSYSEKWWTYGNSSNCTAAQLKEAVEGHFSVDSLTSIIGNERSISGLTTEEFLNNYNKQNIDTPRSMYAQLAYDSVWAIALTLKNTLESAETRGLPNPIENFSYKTNGQDIYKSFVQHMANLDFTGVSGPISFDGPDRRGVSVIEQNQHGNRLRVALYYPENSSLDFSCVGCHQIVWKGKNIPVDKTKEIVKEERILYSAYLAVCVASLSGMAIAFIFLAFNLHYRKLKYIKLSSPKLNNVAAVGCVFVYVSVILLGLDDTVVPDINYIALCMGRAYLWVAGFSLAFGAMFAKTYRVHQIFRRANSGILRSKLLKDSQLLLLIGGLMLLDSFVMTLWIVIDPMEREVRNLTAHPSPDDPDLLFIPQLSTCNCTHLQKWMGSLYAYKGLLLLFGVYMAWETRHVQIPALNDSQYIGMNIYNVVLSSVTVVVLSTGLAEKPTLSYVLISALIIVSTTGMLGLLFFPKIYDICKNKGSPIVTTSGMTIEGNTRRFLVDERKEKYYRAEVENRFLKRKLTQLDQEINRLERLLQMPSEGYLKVNDDAMYLLPDSSPAISQSSLVKHNKYTEPENDHSPSFVNKEEEDEKLTESLLLPNKSIGLEVPGKNCPYQQQHGDYYCCRDTDGEYYQNCNSDMKEIEAEITSDMGHTDVDFEEMMSEMGPPGMLTLIFNNDHIPPPSPQIPNTDSHDFKSRTSSSSSNNGSNNSASENCKQTERSSQMCSNISNTPFTFSQNTSDHTLSQRLPDFENTLKNTNMPENYK